MSFTTDVYFKFQTHIKKKPNAYIKHRINKNMKNIIYTVYTTYHVRRPF